MNLPTSKPIALPKLSERAQLGLVFGIAMFCGLAASLAVYRFLKDKERAMRDNPAAMSTSPVIVARQDLAPGTAVGRLSVEVADWPKNHEPPHSFSSVDRVAGRHVLTRIYRGEPIVETRLVPDGEHGGLSVRIPEGMFAMSVKVSPEIGVSGFIQPGNRVDVFATVKLTRAEPLTKLVLQNILVLAVGHEIESKDQNPDDVTTVTLALTPEEAEKLAAAKSEGDLVLALRNIKDKQLYETPGFSSAELVKERTVRQGGAVASSSESGTPGPEATSGPGKAKPAAGGKDKTEVAAQPATPQPKYQVVELIEAGKPSEFKFKNE